MAENGSTIYSLTPSAVVSLFTVSETYQSQANWFLLVERDDSKRFQKLRSMPRNSLQFNR